MKPCNRREFRQRNCSALAWPTPALVNVQEGISLVAANLDFWKDVPVKRLFEEEFGVPLVLESSTRAQALAERALGAGEGAEDMIYIEYGKGVGAGIMTAGRMLFGMTGSRRVRHIPMLENGPACNCGSFGCLEALVGLSAVEARCRKALLEGSNTRALEIAGRDPAKVTGWTVLEASNLGDKTCIAIVEELVKLPRPRLVNFGEPV